MSNTSLSDTLREQEYVEQLRQQAQSLVSVVNLKHSPEVFWPIVSNTDSMNEKLGLNPTENSFRPTSYGGSQLSVETKAAGLTMAYEEFPFEWQAPHYLQVERIFHKGLVKYLRFRLRLEALSDGGTRLSFEMDYVPAVAGPVVKGVLQLNLKQMIKLVESHDAKLSRGLQGIQVYFDESQKLQAQIEKLCSRWQVLAPESEVPRALATYLLTAPDRYAGRIRPFEIAELYDLRPLETLRFCLQVAQAGYLHIRWDLRCLSCQGPKVNSEHLQGVSAHAFCPSCAVDYAVGFDQNLELTFFPDGALRKVDESHFCAGSPANTPHLPMQANFWPHETRSFKLSLDQGVYVFRSLSVKGELTCVVAPGGVETLQIELGTAFQAQPLMIAPHCQLSVHNPREHFQTLQLENLEWAAQICSGALVSAVQEFRDFFASEQLAEGMVLPILRQTLLRARLSHSGQPLTDLSFLKLIGEAVRQNDGAEVSCEAQTVLAAFQEPLDALKAALMLSQQLVVVNHFAASERPLSLHLSFHEGPCTVESRGGVLDYSGEAVDAVDYLYRQARPGRILVSEGVFADAELKWLLLQEQARIERLYPEVPAALGELAVYQIIPASAALKGGV